MVEPSTIFWSVVTTLETIRPPDPAKRGRPEGSKSPPSKLPQPVEDEHRLAPSVIAPSDPWIEIPGPLEGLRHVVVEGGSMGDAARKGLARAREFWTWLEVVSVAGVTATKTGWKVSLRIVDDQNPYARRRWRFDWYQ